MVGKMSLSHGSWWCKRQGGSAAPSDDARKNALRPLRLIATKGLFGPPKLRSAMTRAIFRAGQD